MKRIAFIRRKVLTLIGFLLMLCAAQAQIQITSHVLPPYLNRIADYSSHPELMVVTVTNISTTELSIQLTARVTGDNGIAAWVKPGYRSPRPILIPAGQTVNLNGNDIAALFDINKIEYTGISRADMTRGVGLLEGNYTLCIRALNYNTLEPISPEQPLGCTSFRISDLEPPRILSPFNEQNVDVKGVQALPITWTTPPGSSPFIQYKLRIVEVIAARNPNDAFLSSRPLFEETIGTNMLLYGPAHPALIPGRQYVMGVQATDPTGKSNFRNRGWSEVTSFRYAGNMIKAPIIVSPEHQSIFNGQGQFKVVWHPIFAAAPTTEYTVNFYKAKTSNISKKGLPLSLPIYSTKIVGNNELLYDFVKMPTLIKGEQYQVEVIASDPTQQQIFENQGKSQPVDFRFDAKIYRDTTKIKGRLVYQFNDDTKGNVFPIANQKVYLSKVYANVGEDANGVPQMTELTGAVANYFNKEEVFGGQYVMTDEDGNFEMPCFFTPADSSGVIPIDKWEVNMGGQQVSMMPPDRKHDLDIMKGKVGVYYKIAVLNPHFKASSELFSLKPGGVQQMNQITLDANAYSLKVNVREIFNNLKGDYVENANIKIYREKVNKENAQYGIPRYEGDILSESEYEQAIQGDKMLIAERTTPQISNKKNGNEAYVTFNSLFKNLPSDGYNYKIVLMDGSTVLREVPFQVVAEGVGANNGSTNSNLKLNNPEMVNYVGGKVLVTAAANQQATDLKLKAVTSNNRVAVANTSTTNALTNAVDSKKSGQVVSANQNKAGLNLADNISKGGSLYGNGITKNTLSKDKWTDYRYNAVPEEAFLTLEKELHVAPRTKLTGNLKYAYKNRAGIPKQAYANMPLKLVVTYDFVESRYSANAMSDIHQEVRLAGGPSAANGDPSFGIGPILRIGESQNRALIDGAANVLSPIGNYYSNVGTQLATYGYTNFTKTEVVGQGIAIYGGGNSVQDNYKVLQTVMTDQEGNFEFDFPNADMAGQYINGSVTMGHGDLAGSRDGQFRRVYRLVPDVSFYCAPDEAIVVQPWESKDIGTYTSFVKTQNIRVQVQRVDRAEQPQTATSFPNVPVNLYYDLNNKDHRYMPFIPGLDKNTKKNINASTPNSGYNNSAAPVISSGATTLVNRIATNNLSYTANIGANYSGTMLSNGVVIPTNNPSIDNQYKNVLMREGEVSNDGGYIEFKDVLRAASISASGSLSYILEADERGRENDVAFYKDYFLSKTHVWTNRRVAADGPQGIEGFIPGAEILFNKDFNPDDVVEYKFRIIPKSTLIRGRVTDNFTTLGVKGVQVKASIVLDGKSYNNQRYNFLFEEVSTTDENGYYAFPTLEKRIEYFNPETINTGTVSTQTTNMVKILYAPGYEKQEVDIGSLSAGLSGRQIVRNFDLKPLGRGAFGYVMDSEDGAPVTARVKLKMNGRWVDTEGVGNKTAVVAAVNRPSNQLALTNFQTLVDKAVQNKQEIVFGTSGSKIQSAKNEKGQINTTLFITSKADLNAGIVEAATQSKVKYGNTVNFVYSGSAQGAANNVAVDKNVTVVGNQQLEQSLRFTPTQFILPYQRFEIDLPARPDSIIIMPYDPAYMPLTAAVNATEPNANLGDFKLTRRKHRINVVVKTKDGSLVSNAKVYIEGAGDDFVRTNMRGEAQFEFVNNSKTNFNVFVTNDIAKYSGKRDGSNDNSNSPMVMPTAIAFMPTSLNNVNSIDDQVQRTVVVAVDRASILRGQVTLAEDGTALRGAQVYLEQGAGANSESEAVTDANGSYAMLVPEPRSVSRLLPANSIKIKVAASYYQQHRTFVGESKSVTLQRDVREQVLDFEITELKDIDISQLYGFNARVSKLEQRQDGSYLVSGNLVNLPEHSDFKNDKFAGREVSLTFKNIAFKKSSNVNADQVPKGVPVAEQIDLVEKDVRLSAFTSFKAQLLGFDQFIRVHRGENDTTGSIEGRVRLVDNSFNFPTSYMTISNQDFYLGKYADGGPDKMNMEVFHSKEDIKGRKYAISKDQGKAIQFKYLGFDGESGVAAARESYVQNDSIHLFLTLNTKIQGGIPLRLDAGKAVITKDKMLPVSSDEPLEFQLEKWKVQSKSWALAPNSGGIVLKNNKILTGKTDLNMPKMSIIPGELIFDKTDNVVQKLTVGGKASIPLHLNQGTEVVFTYDADVGNIPGKGHFKFTLRNDNGEAAFLEKLPGMTRQGDRIRIGYVSVLSNDEEVFGFSQNATPITLQSQLSFTPGSFFSKPEGLTMNGTVNLHLPKLLDNINGSISYSASESGAPVLSIAPLSFSFTGDGGTRFKTTTIEGGQLFGGRGLGIAGTIQMPGTDISIKANLVSMVTSGVQGAASQAGAQAAGEAKAFAEQVLSQAAEDAKKQAEIVIGDYRKQGEEYAAQLLDEVMKDETVRQTREFIENNLKTANNTYNEVMKLGESGKQYYDQIAAKMRLAGSGMNAINSMVDGNPIGGFLQLNGVLRGAVGIDIVDVAKQKTKQVAMQAVKALQEELPVDNLADGMAQNEGGLSGAKFDYDFKTGRMFGSLSMPRLVAGAVILSKVELEMLFEKEGWYFFAGADVLAPVPLIFPLAVGIGIGDHNMVTPQMEAKFTSQSYVKKLPRIFKENGFHGFLFTGRKDIIPETHFAVNFVVADFEVGFGAGFDARIYGSFNKANQEIGVGAMLFAHAYARMAVLGGVCGVSGSVDAEVGVKAKFTNTGGDPSFQVMGCFSANIAARVWCAFVDESIDIGVMGKLSLCAGSSCNKGVEFEFTRNGGSCSKDPDFDY